MMTAECGARSVEGKNRGYALRSLFGSRLSTLDSRLDPRGMTLIELLVVIVIITTLVAAAIPLLSPTNDDRRIREATRGLNTYITGAQARAVASHRPFGIALKRLSQDTKRNDPTKLDNDNGVCLEVFYVEQPAPYSGFDANSRACVALYPNQNDPNHAGQAIVRFVTRSSTAASGCPVGWAGDLFPSNMIRPGDVIEVNGTQFELLNDTGANTNITVTDINNDSTNPTYYFGPATQNSPPQILARPLNDSGQQIGPRYDNKGNEIGSVATLQSPYWTNPAPYKILRQAAIASDEPYQLPEGTAIDLRASGVGTDNYFHVPNVRDNDAQIQIMFTPEGRVARVTYSMAPRDNVENDNAIDNPADLFDQAVVDNVFLLVGRRDRIPAPDIGKDPTLDPAAIPGSPAKTEDQITKLKEPVNWLSGDSRWVVIGSQSGRVATIENANIDLVSFLQTYVSPPQVPASSEALRTQQIKNAREFTHEMKQLGGR